MIGVTGRLTTNPIYSALVSSATVREALNFEDTVPSPLALLHRIEEAAQRIEGLTRLALVSGIWEFIVKEEAFRQQDFREDEIFIPGLFPVGSVPSPVVTDKDGGSITVTATPRGQGDILQIAAARPYREFGLPIKIVVERGATGAQLPADLRSAIITQVEMLVDGFSPMAENSIIRTCSRWGWIG